MTLYATITNGRVSSIDSFDTEIRGEYFVDLTGLSRLPEIGTSYVDGEFVFPRDPMFDIKKRKITIGAFRRRLTLTEKVALTLSTDPVVTVLMEDLATSSFVDLDFTALKDGINYLVSIDILTPERVTALLADGNYNEF